MFALSVLTLTMLLGGVVFVPLFVIALIRLPSARLAFITSASFSIGAMIGFSISLWAAALLIPRYVDEAWNNAFLIAFVGAGTIGGAALALSLARRSLKPPN